MSDPLRILVGMPLATPMGGAERYLQLVAREAARHDLRLQFVLNEEGPLVGELRDRGWDVEVVPTGRFRNLPLAVLAVARLRRIVRRTAPDLVLSWLPRSHVYLAPAARLAGLPASRIAWWQHHLPEGEVLDRLATVLPAGTIIVASEAVARAQGRLRPRRPTPLVRYGVDDPADPSPSQLQQLRARLGLPHGAAVVGISGRLVRWKRQDVFLDAIALLRSDGLDVHALVLGGGGHGLDPGYDRELEARAAEPDLAGHVTFTGHVEDTRPYLRLADVLVNASLNEPFGLTIVEAQAAGVPAVAVGMGGPTESIEHGRSGWLVPDGSATRLASALSELLRDAGLRRRLAEGGRASYLEDFTTHAALQRLAALLRSLDASGGPRLSSRGLPGTSTSSSRDTARGRS